MLSHAAFLFIELRVGQASAHPGSEPCDLAIINADGGVVVGVGKGPQSRIVREAPAVVHQGQCVRCLRIAGSIADRHALRLSRALLRHGDDVLYLDHG